MIFAAIVLAQALSLDPEYPWTSQGTKGGPRVEATRFDGSRSGTATRFGDSSSASALRGWTFTFESGDMAHAGYVQCAVDGTDWYARGKVTFRIDARPPVPADLQFVVVYADTVERWSREHWKEIPVRRGAPHFLRFEAAEGGVAERRSLQVREVQVRLGESNERPTLSAATIAASSPGRPESPLFPFGAFILGGNRAALFDYAQRGPNVVVEYGPADWPFPVVEDHLDFAHAAGLGVGASIVSERLGKLRFERRRLAPLFGHPAFWAAYTLDEPDGAQYRRHREEESSPPALTRESKAIRESSTVPILLTCMDSFGLSRYADTADILSTDPYLPAYSPQSSFAAVFSAASATAEIAARTAAQPITVLQLFDPQWTKPEQQQTPASLRAQAYASLAAGAQGLLFFQGVGARREAIARGRGGSLWEEFLQLGGEFAAIAPLASRWSACPGALDITPGFGEVRARAFSDGEDWWIVLVNLGRRPVQAKLTGGPLVGAEAIEEALSGDRRGVAGGTWEGRLEALEAGLWRVRRDQGASAESGSAAVADSLLGAPAGSGSPARADSVRVLPKKAPKRAETKTTARALVPTGILRVSDCLVGCTLDPAPPGGIGLEIDGVAQEVSLPQASGPATFLRVAARLSSGEHRVRVSWGEAGVGHDTTWTFTIDEKAPASGADIRDSFDGPRLNTERWTPVDRVYWGAYDEKETPAQGSIDVARGSCRIRSTGGSFGMTLRGVESPATFECRLSVRLPKPGEVVIQRNELLRRLQVPAGRHQIRFLESPGRQTFHLDGKVVATETPLFDHQRGALGIGVGAGSEVFFEEFFLSPSPPSGEPTTRPDR